MDNDIKGYTETKLGKEAAKSDLSKGRVRHEG